MPKDLARRDAKPGTKRVRDAQAKPDDTRQTRGKRNSKPDITDKRQSKQGGLLFTVEQIRQALIAGRGIYAQAARYLTGPNGAPMSRRYVADYVNRTPELLETVRQIEEARLDLAEAKLMDKLEQGFFPAVRFYLTTKGKDRGYVPRTEATGKDGAPLFDYGALAAGISDEIARLYDRIASTSEAAAIH